MLIVVRKGKEKLQKIFEKWDLVLQIGEVTSGTQLKFYMNTELVAVSGKRFTCIRWLVLLFYNREYSVPAYFMSKRFSIDQVEEPDDLKEIC